jgi:hypothetical protein
MTGCCVLTRAGLGTSAATPFRFTWLVFRSRVGQKTRQAPESSWIYSRPTTRYPIPSRYEPGRLQGAVGRPFAMGDSQEHSGLAGQTGCSPLFSFMPVDSASACMWNGIASETYVKNGSEKLRATLGREIHPAEEGVEARVGAHEVEFGSAFQRDDEAAGRPVGALVQPIQHFPLILEEPVLEGDE